MSRPTYTRERFLAFAEGTEIDRDKMLASGSWDDDEAMEHAITVASTYRDVAQMIVDGKGFHVFAFAITYDEESDVPQSVDKGRRLALVHPLVWLRAQCQSDESWLQVLNDITDIIVEFARVS